MKIYLLDINKDMTIAWQEYFKDFDNVEIINDSFSNFMNLHIEIDGIVSPANSFGLMDGGYDKAIIDYLGQQAQTNVFTLLSIVYNGYQPVGTSLCVPFGKYIILHTPTMRTPEKIIDDRIIYDCMYSCILEAKKKNLSNIVIPAFGGCTGDVPYRKIAKLMYLAYKDVNFKGEKCNWRYARHIKQELV